jgi:two-component sensor histidine kinase
MFFHYTVMQTAHIPAAGVLILAIHAAAWGQPSHPSTSHPVLPSEGYVHASWGTDEGLPSADTWPILQDRAGYIWIGTGFGVVRFDGSRFTPFNARTTPVIRGQEVRAIHEDSRGRIWIGIMNAGVAIYDHGHFFTPSWADSFTYRTVTGIFADSAGGTCLCTSVGAYVVRNDTVRKITTIPESPRSGFTRPDGAVFLIGKTLTHYAGPFHRSRMVLPITPEAFGVNDVLFEGDSLMYVIRLGEIRRYAFHPDRPATLEAVFPCPGAVKMLKNGENGYFVGTVGSGVIYFDRKAFSRPQGLGVQRGAGRQVHSIMHGLEGDLWATTSGGLYRFSRTFFTILGVDAGEAVSLPAGAKRIQIDFSALRFQSPGRVMFRYRLGGVDKDWVYRPGSQNSATYTNTGPGDLWFNLAASVNGGPWSEKPATLRISVARYFYEEPWLQAAGGLALISLVMGAYRWRTRRVRERNRQLEAEVQRRIEAETKIRISLDEKTVMLKEIHHRVKNNLQIISSLFSLQFGSSNDPLVQAMLKDSQTRIRSMALVHEALYRSNNLAAIDFREYVQGLAAQIAHAHRRMNVDIRFAGESITLSLDQAIPAGLIMNEALSNAYKHAFPGDEEGTITVHLGTGLGTHAEITVSDTGPGLPDGFDPETVPSLGFHLILALTEQLNGTLTIDGKPGTTIRVKFPIA